MSSVLVPSPVLDAGSPDIVVNDTPYPMNLGISLTDLRKIVNHPRFCWVCCNLFARSAYALLPRSDISMHEGKNVIAMVQKQGNEVDNDKHELVEDFELDYKSWQFTATSMDMQAQADDNCASCWILLNGIKKLSDASPPELRIQNGMEFEAVVIFCKGNVLKVQVDKIEKNTSSPIAGTMGLQHSMACEFYTVQGNPCPWPTIGSLMESEDPSRNISHRKGGWTRHIPSEPVEDDYLNTIQQLLKHCIEGHPLCRQELEATPSGGLPKRVIYVGSCHNSIRIIEHHDQQGPLNERYIALSHRWGLMQHVRSLKANIANFKENLPWHELKKTFKEAITLTRKLGIKYLWIDSLCIIQDDTRDWQIEASKMASIYNGAYLVIAATGSVDGDGGLYINKAPYVTLKGEDQHRKPFQIFVRHQLNHGSITRSRPNGDFHVKHEAANPNYPLVTRAWCFQERLLGPRVLHFTRYELVLECITSMNCECGALADFSGDSVLPVRRLLSTKRSPDASNHPLNNESDLGKVSELIAQTQMENDFTAISYWRDLVTAYSEKLVTRSSDWLPALSGLAAKLESPETGRYIAGLWSKDLLDSLLWESLAVAASNIKPTYIAPSWSWASIQGPVEWTHNPKGSRHYIEIDLENTICIPSGLNRLGEIAAGWLFLTGSVIEVVVDRVRGDGVWVESSGSTKRIPTDSVICRADLSGQKVTCLKHSRYLNYPSDHVLWLVRVQKEDEVMSTLSLPDHVKNFPSVYRRIGVQKYCELDSWQFDARSTVISMYII